MMYDRMIEEYEQKQSEYRATLDAMIERNYFGTALQVVKAKIEMCSEFIAFLKRCEQQEIELERRISVFRRRTSDEFRDSELARHGA